MLFKTDESLIDHVEKSLSQALPKGWTWKRESGSRLRWTFRSTHALTSAPDEDFRLWVSRTDGLYVFLHGNSDAGCFDVNQVMQNASLIDADALKFFALTDIIKNIIEHKTPNQWGFT